MQDKVTKNKCFTNGNTTTPHAHAPLENRKARHAQACLGSDQRLPIPLNLFNMPDSNTVKRNDSKYVHVAWEGRKHVSQYTYKYDQLRKQGQTSRSVRSVRCTNAVSHMYIKLLVLNNNHKLSIWILYKVKFTNFTFNTIQFYFIPICDIGILLRWFTACYVNDRIHAPVVGCDLLHVMSMIGYMHQ